MRRLLWILAWVAVAVWSLFAWGAYGLFELFGNVAVRNADLVSDHPETVEWLSWALAALQGMGLAAIVIVWGVVSLLILAVPAVVGLVLGRPANQSPQGWQMQDPGADRSPPRGPIRRIERR